MGPTSLETHRTTDLPRPRPASAIRGVTSSAMVLRRPAASGGKGRIRRRTSNTAINSQQARYQHQLRVYEHARRDYDMQFGPGAYERYYAAPPPLPGQ
jgi:hypothetical protein